jgi:hypothetical protein
MIHYYLHLVKICKLIDNKPGPVVAEKKFETREEALAFVKTHNAPSKYKFGPPAIADYVGKLS